MEKSRRSHTPSRILALSTSYIFNKDNRGQIGIKDVPIGSANFHC